MDSGGGLAQKGNGVKALTGARVILGGYNGRTSQGSEIGRIEVVPRRSQQRTLAPQIHVLCAQVYGVFHVLTGFHGLARGGR